MLLQLFCYLLFLLVGSTGETAAEIVARLKRDMLPTTISGLIYWPMCDFVTFKFIPVQLQVALKFFSSLQFGSLMNDDRAHR